MSPLVLPLLLAAAPPTHCGKEQVTVFSCAVKKKVLSLCAGLADGTPEWLQYRFGAPKKPELVFPKERDGSLERFRLAHRELLSGTSTAVAFVVAGASYEVYAQDGKEAGAGVVVRKGSAPPVTLACTDGRVEGWDAVKAVLKAGDVEDAARADRCRRAASGYADWAFARAQGQMDGVQQGELYEEVQALCFSGWAAEAAECAAKKKLPCKALTAEQQQELDAQYEKISNR